MQEQWPEQWFNGAEEDTDLELIVDQIEEDEEDIKSGLNPLINQSNTYYPRKNNQYYIGMHFHLPERHELIMSGTVHPLTFYKYSGENIERYLYETRCYEDIDNPKIEIMQLCITNNETYLVVLKTFWIRLLQRRWRNVYNRRRQ